MPNRRLSLPWPHRCPECQHWTLGTLEGFTRIRFDVCPPCTIGIDRETGEWVGVEETTP